MIRETTIEAVVGRIAIALALLVVALTVLAQVAQFEQNRDDFPGSGGV